MIATFSSHSNGDFSVWILDANTDGFNVGNTFVGLGVNGGAAVNTATVYQGLNEFTRYDVTGALSTDVFQVYATYTVGNSWSSIGGCFQPFSVDVSAPALVPMKAPQPDITYLSPVSA